MHDGYPGSFETAASVIPVVVADNLGRGMYRKFELLAMNYWEVRFMTSDHK